MFTKETRKRCTQERGKARGREKKRGREERREKKKKTLTQARALPGLPITIRRTNLRGKRQDVGRRDSLPGSLVLVVLGQSLTPFAGGAIISLNGFYLILTRRFLSARGRSSNSEA